MNTEKITLPEGYAAVRAARANRLQSNLNLPLGSSLASNGLTIPTVATIAIIFNLPLSLGISSLNMTNLSFILHWSVNASDWQNHSIAWCGALRGCLDRLVLAYQSL